MRKQEVIAQISDLPVRDRLEITDAILQTLNQPNLEIEQAWMEEVDRRASEVESGEVEMIPGEQVIGELKKITGE